MVAVIGDKMSIFEHGEGLPQQAEKLGNFLYDHVLQKHPERFPQSADKDRLKMACEFLFVNFRVIIQSDLSNIQDRLGILGFDVLRQMIRELSEIFEQSIDFEGFSLVENGFASYAKRFAEDFLEREMSDSDFLILFKYFTTKARFLDLRKWKKSFIAGVYEDFFVSTFYALGVGFGDEALLPELLDSIIDYRSKYSREYWNAPLSDDVSYIQKMNVIMDIATMFPEKKAVLAKQIEKEINEYLVYLEKNHPEEVESRRELYGTTWFESNPSVVVRKVNNAKPVEQGLSEDTVRDLTTAIMKYMEPLRSLSGVEDLSTQKAAIWIARFLTHAQDLEKIPLSQMVSYVQEYMGINPEDFYKFGATVKGFYQLIYKGLYENHSDLVSLAMKIAPILNITGLNATGVVTNLSRKMQRISLGMIIGFESFVIDDLNPLGGSRMRLILLNKCASFLAGSSLYEKNSWDSEVINLMETQFTQLDKTEVSGILDVEIEEFLQFVSMMKDFELSGEFLSIVKTNVSKLLNSYLSFLNDLVLKGELDLESLKRIYKKFRNRWGKSNEYFFNITHPQNNTAIPEMKRVNTPELKPQTDFANYEYNGELVDCLDSIIDKITAEHSIEGRSLKKLKDAIELRLSPQYYDVNMDWDGFNRTYPYEKGSIFNRGGVVRGKNIDGCREVHHDTGYEFYNVQGDLYLVSEYDFADQKIRFSIKQLKIDVEKRMAEKVEVKDEIKKDVELADQLNSFFGFPVVPVLETESLNCGVAVGDFVINFVLREESGYYRDELQGASKVVELIKSNRNIFLGAQEKIRSHIEGLVCGGSNLSELGIIFGEEVLSKRFSLTDFWKIHGNVVSRKILEYVLGIKSADKVDVEAFTPSALSLITKNFADKNTIVGWKSWLGRKSYRSHMLTLEGGQVATLITYLDTLTH